MASDDSLPCIQNIPIPISSSRAITPSRGNLMIPCSSPGPSSDRYHSNPRSNPRSNSASKLKSLTSTYQAQISNNGVSNRSTSQRKRRQYENDNCHHLFKYIMNKDDIDTSDEANAQDRMYTHIGWRSTLGKLYESHDYETLELFRRCQDDISLNHQIRKKKISLPPHLMNYLDAHKSFLNIEKKLRNVVYASIKREPHLLGFIGDWEKILIHFAEFKDVPNQLYEYPSLSAQLNSTLDISEDGMVIFVDLRDSRLARLMLHFVVKFYGCNYNVSQRNMCDNLITVALFVCCYYCYHDPYYTTIERHIPRNYVPKVRPVRTAMN